MSEPLHPAREAASDSDSGTATDAEVVAATRRWIERAVIGLNLCPFTRVPFMQDRIRFRVSRATDEAGLVADLREELQMLHAADPQACETTLLIHPDVLGDFLDFNDFLDTAEEVLRELDLEGEIQVASFHPDYQFADADADAIENCTNRAPWPTLHLLRESSIDQALASGIDTDAIYQRNIETLRRLGGTGWQALWRDDDPA
jgi:hypothetical protein